MPGRLVEEIKGKKYSIIIEAGKDPKTGKRKRIYRTFHGRKPDAEKELANIIRELEHGTYIEPSKTTVAEYLKYWLNAYGGNLAPSTLASYTRIINAHLIPGLGGIELLKLQPLQIQTYYSQKLNAGRADKKTGGLSPRTVQYHHTVLREALQHAVMWRMIIINPADATEPPRPIKAEIHPLTQEQLDKLLTLAGEKQKRDNWLYMFAAYTGMRQGELLALEWSAVDIDCKKPYARVQQTVGYINGKGYVFRAIGKTKKSRREIALLDQAVYALRQQKKMLSAERLSAPPGEYQETNLVFPTNRGKPQDPTEVGHRLKRLSKKIGCPNARFHDLRHTFATMMLELGVHPKLCRNS